MLRAGNTGLESKSKTVLWCSCFMVCLAVPHSVQVLYDAALISVSELRAVGCFPQPVINSRLSSRSSNWSIFLRLLLLQDTSVILEERGEEQLTLKSYNFLSSQSLGTTDMGSWDIYVFWVLLPLVLL